MHKYVVYPINNADTHRQKESFVNSISKYFQLEYEFIVGIILVKSSKTKILGFRSRDPSICDVLQQIYRISKSDSISLITTRINGKLEMGFFYKYSNL